MVQSNRERGCDFTLEHVRCPSLFHRDGPGGQGSCRSQHQEPGQRQNEGMNTGGRTSDIQPVWLQSSRGMWPSVESTRVHCSIMYLIWCFTGDHQGPVVEVEECWMCPAQFRTQCFPHDTPCINTQRPTLLQNVSLPALFYSSTHLPFHKLTTSTNHYNSTLPRLRSIALRRLVNMLTLSFERYLHRVLMTLTSVTASRSSICRN